MIRFFMPMIPPTTTAQMHKVAHKNRHKPTFYDPPEVKDMKAKLRAHLAPHAPSEPMLGCLRLVVKWTWPGSDEYRYKPTKPDTDNLQKATKDIMTKLGFWRDDAQVASEIVEKFTGPVPGIFVQIESLEGGISE
jgi:Holliday junction resolvase RusA-like endonuclease